jgi:hypothetical protein
VQPETKYARMGQDRIAYQVLGQGPPDLVMALPSLGHVDIVWEDPGLALFLRSLASFSRLIFFNRRGSGASDPLPHDPLPTWESHAQELAVVLDEVGSERAALLAEADVGPMPVLGSLRTSLPDIKTRQASDTTPRAGGLGSRRAGTGQRRRAPPGSLPRADGHG